MGTNATAFGWRRNGIQAILGVALNVWMTGPAQAQTDLKRLYPPCVRSGETTEIAAEGKFDSWPVQLECDRSDVRIACAETKGKLVVNVDGGASPGVAWVRLYDSVSASNLLPLRIVRAPVSIETEPNARPGEAGVVAMPAAIVGRLSERSDVDTFALDVSVAGRVTVRAMANRVFLFPVDLVLQICDRDGNVLAQNDDACGLDPRVSFDVDRPGRLYVRVFGFPETPNSTIGFASSADYIYVMAVSMEPSVEFFMPLVASDAPPWSAKSVLASGEIVPTARVLPPTAVSPPTAVDREDPLAWQWLPRFEGQRVDIEAPDNQIAASELPVAVAGCIAAPGEVDSFRISPQAGGEYELEIWSSRLGFALDPRVEVTDEAGKVVAAGDDLGRNDFETRLKFKAPSDQGLWIRVMDAVGTAGPRHAYAMFVRAAVPDYRLILPAEKIEIASGGTVSCKIRIERQFGLQEPIAISAEGLPPGVTCQPVESEPTGDTSKEVELVIAASDRAEEYQGWIRVVGRTGADDATTRRAVFPLRPDVALESIWLTVRRGD